MYRCISDFKKGYQPRTNIGKDDKSDLVAVSDSKLARRRKYVRRTEIQTAEPLLPEAITLEFELVIKKLKSHISPGIDQTPAELFKVGVEQFAMRSMNLLFLFVIRRNCLSSGRIRSLYLSIRGAIKQTPVIIGARHFCQLRTKIYPTSFCQS